MSSTHGWIKYEGGKITFPFIPRHHVVWNCAIAEWCQKNRIPFEYVDASWVAAKVTRDQIEDFIKFVYGASVPADRFKGVSALVHEPHRQLELLRAAVFEKLSADGKFVLSGLDY